MNGDPSHSHNHAPLVPSTSTFSMQTSSSSNSIPSARPPPAPSIPSLYLPPPGPPLPQTLLASTQDLISRFNLLPAYDKYVRSNLTAVDGPSAPGPSAVGSLDQSHHTTQGPIASVTVVPSGGNLDKGKGKEVFMDGPGGVGVPPMGGPSLAAGMDEDAKSEKKRKNTYKHLIKGIPGKHSMKKDDYLSTTMLVPPKQRIPITPFDARTQRDAFTVSLEGLKGWNIYTLVEESPQAKEDRKKRKELKRLAKAQSAALAAAAQQAGSAGQDPSVHASVPATAQARLTAAGGASPNGVGTPRPTGTSTPRSSSIAPRPGATVTATGIPTANPTPVKAQAQSPNPITRPGSAVARPKSAVPRPGSPKPPTTLVPTAAPLPARSGSSIPVPGAAVNTPLRSGTPMQVDQQRGKKREREDGMVNGVTAGHGPPIAAVTNIPSVVMVDAKPGVTAARPRPIKKQRMDMQGQARDVAAPVQQQPTPQGV